MSPSRRDLSHLALSFACVGLLVAVLRSVAVTNPTTVALALLLVVLSTAMVARLWVTVACAMAAMLSLNFFFMPPVGTLRLADPQNWIALVVFLIVGFVARQLSATSKAREVERMTLLAERRQAELLRQKAELASTLLASLSHDLRTPLTAATVAVENLQRVELSGADREAQSRIALTELNRLTRVFHEILEMARIDADALAVERDWVSPADIVDASLSSLAPMLSGRQVDVDVESRATVFVDPKLTSAALNHLVENAVRYSPASRAVEIRGTVTPHGLQLVVRDHGDGVDPVEVSQLFQRFFRGRAGASHPGGIGMGLAITRGLIAAEGGQVWAENVPGGGAQFTLSVPAPSQPAAVAQDA